MGASFSTTYYQFISIVCPQIHAQMVMRNTREVTTAPGSCNNSKKEKENFYSIKRKNGWYAL